MILFKSRKWQVWGIVTVLWYGSLFLIPVADLVDVFILMWAGYFAFTSSIIAAQLTGKGIGMHHERSSKPKG